METWKSIEQHQRNGELFRKSYFGKKMAKNNLHTPDRDQVPDDHDKFKDCIVCKGTGKVIFYADDPEDEDDTETCPTCKGQGTVETEDWEEEW